MRKIEKEMIAAITAGKSFNINTQQNTKVTPRAKGPNNYYCDVTLYGHRIATLYFRSIESKNPCLIVFSACGYNTTTTRSRLNALFNTFGVKPSDGVNTKRGQMQRTQNGITYPMESTGTYNYGTEY